MVIIRYLVDNVDYAIAFYTDRLGFTLDQKMGTAFARLSKDHLELWLSGPQSSAAHSMPDGSRPKHGGWNRFVIQVENLTSLVEILKKANASFRNEIINGPGGKQILLEDPSGNPIELFEPAK